MKRLTGLAVIIIIAGCGGGEPSETTCSNEAAVDTLRMFAADTIGSEMGTAPDIFAFIMSAAFTPDGNIAVLDAGKVSLQVFSPDGEELMSPGRQGSGPGEYQMPMGLAVNDESFIVSDISGGKMIFFSPEGELESELRGFSPVPPSRIIGSVGRSFLSADIFMEVNSEGASASMDLVAYADSSEPVITYSSYAMEMSGGMINADNFADLAFAAGPEGEAYLAERSDSAFVLTGYLQDGTEFLSISEDRDRIPLTEEELQEEQLALSISIMDGETSLGRERVPVSATHRQIIHGLGADGQGNIWVEMGDELDTYFRVYSPDGTLRQIVIPDLSIQDGARYSITPYGMLAYDGDPEDWPKIYLLEVEEY